MRVFLIYKQLNLKSITSRWGKFFFYGGGGYVISLSSYNQGVLFPRIFVFSASPLIPCRTDGLTVATIHSFKYYSVIVFFIFAASALLNQLQHYHWIDSFTRAILIDVQVSLHLPCVAFFFSSLISFLPSSSFLPHSIFIFDACLHSSSWQFRRYSHVIRRQV